LPESVIEELEDLIEDGDYEEALNLMIDEGIVPDEVDD